MSFYFLFFSIKNTQTKKMETESSHMQKSSSRIGSFDRSKRSLDSRDETQMKDFDVGECTVFYYHQVCLSIVRLFALHAIITQSLPLEKPSNTSDDVWKKILEMKHNGTLSKVTIVKDALDVWYLNVECPDEYDLIVTNAISKGTCASEKYTWASRRQWWGVRCPFIPIFGKVGCLPGVIRKDEQGNIPLTLGFEMVHRMIRIPQNLRNRIVFTKLAADYRAVPKFFQMFLWSFFESYIGKNALNDIIEATAMRKSVRFGRLRSFENAVALASDLTLVNFQAAIVSQYGSIDAYNP